MKWSLSLSAGTALSKKNAFGKSFQKTTAVSRTSMKKLQAVPTTCGMCPAGCGLVAFLNGDRLVQLLGGNRHPVNRGGICAKGLAGVNLVNDPERVLFPMKRRGNRGGGEWTSITWDEALLILKNRLQRLIEEKKTSRIFLDTGREDPLVTGFFRSLGNPHILNRRLWNRLQENSASAEMAGYSELSPDISNARTILNFGANPMAGGDHYIAMARRLVEARLNKGAKLITFDVRLSKTAARSDAWFPVKSGTDGLLALSLAHVIVENGLMDKAFFSRHPDISLSGIKKHLSTYTPAFASKICGVSAPDIHRTALTFAENKPSLAVFGGGAADHANGRENVKCILFLNDLAGNIGIKGGLNPKPVIEGLEPDAPGLEETALSGRLLWDQASLNPETSIDTYFAVFSNPVYDDPDCSATEKWMSSPEKLPFLAVVDTHMTETAALADLFLPAATFLEGWGLNSADTLDGYAVANLTQPAVSLMGHIRTLRSPAYDTGKWLEHEFKPLGESREPGNIFLDLAAGLGKQISGKFPYKNTREYVRKKFLSLETPDSRNGFTRLKYLGFHVPENGSHAHPQSGKTKPFPLSAGLPEYQPIRNHQALKKEEFILTPFSSNLTAYGTSNSKWCREIRHANRLWLNTASARELGLQNGDKVRVVSGAGTLTVRLLTTGRIHPRSAALERGVGHKAVGRTAAGKKFKSKDRDTLLIWWKNNGNGVNPGRVIEKRQDARGTGPADKDTVIRVEKKEK